MRVCVIGAGAAGICVARRTLEDAEKHGIADVEVRVFEQTDRLGGTWVLDERIGSGDLAGPHSSMYYGLRTNLPKETMQFEHFPMETADDKCNESGGASDSFPGSEEVLAYLQRFALPVLPLIEFNTRVISVRPSSSATDGQWSVTVRHVNSSTSFSTSSFNAVFVCSGNFWTPRLPRFVTNLRTLPWTHSHVYRRAEQFAGKTVAVVGASRSGVDIAQQLVPHAKKIYLLHRNYNQKNKDNKGDDISMASILENGQVNVDEGMCNSSSSSRWYCGWSPTAGGDGCPLANLEESFRVLDATEGSLMLADGSELGVENGGLDAVIFCTGYEYSLPFFDDALVRCAANGSFVSPLWAHLVHVRHPTSLFFIGLPFHVLPFPLFDCQTRFALSLLHGRIKPPPLEVMVHWEKSILWELECKRLPAKMFHSLGGANGGCWHYMDWLDRLSGANPQSTSRTPVMRAIWEHCGRKRGERPATYRNIRYRVVNDREFREDECTRGHRREEADEHNSH